MGRADSDAANTRLVLQVDEVNVRNRRLRRQERGALPPHAPERLQRAFDVALAQGQLALGDDEAALLGGGVELGKGFLQELPGVRGAPDAACSAEERRAQRDAGSGRREAGSGVHHARSRVRRALSAAGSETDGIGRV